MINPLAFVEDDWKRDHWHIRGPDGVLCGALHNHVEWHLPDEAFVRVMLCLDCWERLSISVPWCNAEELRKTLPPSDDC